MWRVREFAKGEWMSEDVRILVGEERPPVLEGYLGELKGFLDSVETEAPLDLMHRYASGGPVVAGDAIGIWGGKAEDSWSLPSEGEQAEAEHHAVRFVEGHRLEWRINDEPESVVWHDETIALIPLRAGIDAIEITYRREISEPDNREMRVPGWPRYPCTYLDLRAFVGTNSSTQDGLIEGSRVILKKSANAAGVLVGRVVNLLSGKPRRMRRDPLWAKRITEYEVQFPRIRNAIPDLRSLPAKTSTMSAIVAVHGLFSCGIGIARHFESPQPRAPMYRFEHDTFVNVTKNAQDLADLVMQKLDTSNLLLISHSRGGLVARMAAAKLEVTGAVSHVEVWTYGTPHQGTPLVYAGQRTLGALYGLGRVAVGSIPVAWPLQAAMRFLIGGSELPQGVQDLEPGRSFLATLDLSTASCSVESFAGDFDPQTSSGSGYGVIFAKSLGQAAFNGKNDLVVPTNSAEAAGIPRRVKDCDHFSYFEKAALRKPIVQWPGP